MKSNTKQLCLAAVMTACVFVVTRFIQIPIPLGYFNVGNTIILLFCLCVDRKYAIAAAAAGSALADLTSYPAYTVPTLVIKALMSLLFFVVLKVLKDKKGAVIISAAAATLIPLFGYVITGGIIYGNMITGLAQFPGLLLEYAANLILITLLYKPVLMISRAY